MTPEQKARVSIDALLVQAGWHVCNVADANIHAATGVAIREFPLNTGFGFADYPANRPPAVIVPDCIKLRSTSRGVDPSFMEYAIASRVVQDQILSIPKGVAQLKVNLANFSSIALPLFPTQNTPESSPKSTATRPSSAKSQPRSIPTFSARRRCGSHL